MPTRVIGLSLLFVSVSAFAAPDKLDALIAQKKCVEVPGKFQSYDCFIDQPDGSVKKERFFRAMGRRQNHADKTEAPATNSEVR